MKVFSLDPSIRLSGLSVFEKIEGNWKNIYVKEFYNITKPASDYLKYEKDEKKSFQAFSPIQMKKYFDWICDELETHKPNIIVWETYINNSKNVKGIGMQASAFGIFAVAVANYEERYGKVEKYEFSTNSFFSIFEHFGFEKFNEKGKKLKRRNSKEKKETSILVSEKVGVKTNSDNISDSVIIFLLYLKQIGEL